MFSCFVGSLRAGIVLLNSGIYIFGEYHSNLSVNSIQDEVKPLPPKKSNVNIAVSAEHFFFFFFFFFLCIKVKPN